MNLKKKGITSLVIIVILCGTVIGIVNVLKTDENSNDVAYVSDKIDIPQIQFPQSGGEISDSIKYENHINRVENAEIGGKVIFTSNELVQERHTKAIKAFSMTGSPTTDAGNVITFENEDGILELYENGGFFYQKSNSDMKKLTFTDKECIDIAQEFLVENALLANDFVYSGVGFDTFTDMQNPENSYVIEKQIYFERLIGGTVVDGNSRIFISIDGNGEIASAYSSYQDIDKYQDANEVVELSEAIDAISKQEGLIAVDEEANRVSLEKAELIYWEDSGLYSENNTIQPVYRITGTAYIDDDVVGEFVAIESAVK